MTKWLKAIWERTDQFYKGYIFSNRTENTRVYMCVVMVYTDSYKSFNNVVLQNGFSSCEGRG